MEQLFSRGTATQPDEMPETDEPESTVLANTANPVIIAGESTPVAVTEPPIVTDILPIDAVESGSSAIPIPPTTAAETRSEREKTGPKIWDRRTMSAAAESTVHRLKRALSADSNADLATVDPLTRQHPVRVRVDGLVHEAEELLESGEFQDAKVLAERAANLATTVALDYLPNEERPDDLLQKIVTAIDERDRAPSVTADGPSLPVLELPRDNIKPQAVAEEIIPPVETATVKAVRKNHTMSVVAANRPALLSLPTLPTERTPSPTDLVVMGSIMEVAETPKLIDPVTAVGIAAPSAIGARLRANSEAGPLLVPSESRPVPPQVAEVSPLPAYTSAVAPRAATLATDAPTFTFVWNDLWPLWGLAIVAGIVSLALLARRWVTGH
jgi:hypothetical protein